MKELIAAIVADGVIEADEVKQLKDAIYDDGIVDLDEIVAAFEAARACKDESDGDLYTLLRDMVVERFLGDDGQVDEDEVLEIAQIFSAADVCQEFERQILYVVFTSATAVCPSYDAFCSERNALEL